MPDRSLQTNAADPRQRKYADQMMRRDDAQILEYVKVVLATPAGRAVLWHLMREARTALRAVEGGDGAQKVGALALFGSAAEDVQPRRYQALLDLHDPLPQFEDAAVSLFSRLVTHRSNLTTQSQTESAADSRSRLRARRRESALRRRP